MLTRSKGGFWSGQIRKRSAVPCQVMDQGPIGTVPANAGLRPPGRGGRKTGALVPGGRCSLRSAGPGGWPRPERAGRAGERVSCLPASGPCGWNGFSTLSGAGTAPEPSCPPVSPHPDRSGPAPPPCIPLAIQRRGRDIQNTGGFRHRTTIARDRRLDHDLLNLGQGPPDQLVRPRHRPGPDRAAACRASQDRPHSERRYCG